MVIEEFQGQNAHFDQVGTVDAFEAGGDYRADAQEQGALGGPVARAAGTIQFASDDDGGGA